MKKLFLAFSILLFIGCKKSEPPEIQEIWHVEYQILCTQQATVNGHFSDEFGDHHAILGIPGSPNTLNLDDPWPPTPWSHVITIDSSVSPVRSMSLELYHGVGPNDNSNPPLYTLRILVNGEVATEYTTPVSDHWGITYDLQTHKRTLFGIQYPEYYPNDYYP